MPIRSDANAGTPVSTRTLIMVGAIAAAGFALTFGAARLDDPQELLAQTAQLGLAAATVQAATLATEVGYLPARIAVQAHVVEDLPPQF